MLVVAHCAKAPILLRVDETGTCSTTQRAFSTQFAVLISCLSTQKRFIPVSSRMTVSIGIADDTILISIISLRQNSKLVLKIFLLRQFFFFEIVLLQPLFIYDLLGPRVQTDTPIIVDAYASLRILLFELLYGMVATSYLRVLGAIHASFLNQLAFRVISIFLFHPQQVLLILRLVVVRVNCIWRVWSMN